MHITQGNFNKKWHRTSLELQFSTIVTSFHVLSVFLLYAGWIKFILEIDMPIQECARLSLSTMRGPDNLHWMVSPSHAKHMLGRQKRSIQIFLI